MKTARQLLWGLWGIFVGALVTYGCAAMTHGYGKLVLDQTAQKTFENFQIEADMNYYFSGSDVWPDAIIGVDKAYTMDSTLWRKMVATPEAFKNLVSGMKSRPSTPLLHGYAILDDKGKQIGVWFSIFGVGSYVRMEGDKALDIGTPTNPIRPELRAP